MKYDYLVVGAGLFGCVFAHEMKEAGKKVLVIDERIHVGGMCYTEKIKGIDMHRYGAHIFHTDDEEVWNYVNRFAEFNNYRHRVVANYKDEIYSLPFNMYTFSKIANVTTVGGAKRWIDSDRVKYDTPKNLEEQCISMVGKTIYTKLVKSYTEKQWGTTCDKLSPDIIKRLPLRFTYNDNYFNDKYQGIPFGGYTLMCEKLLDGIPCVVNTPYTKEMYDLADKIIYTGPIDELMDYKYGKLQYRGLVHVDHWMNVPDYQGIAVMNYTSDSPLYTRIIEHKHFENVDCPYTVITEEYSSNNGTRFYPINDNENTCLYNRYVEELDSKFIVAGRLGSYKYYDMDDTIRAALDLSKKEKENAKD